MGGPDDDVRGREPEPEVRDHRLRREHAGAGVDDARAERALDGVRRARGLVPGRSGCGLRVASGKLGFIGGVEIDLIKKFEAGFTAGAKAVNPDATVEVKYITQPPDITGFNDPAKGKAIGKAMYDSGIDIVYAAAGGSGKGLFEAAKESGKTPGEIYAIGVDSDQYTQVSADLQPYILPRRSSGSTSRCTRRSLTR